MGKEQLAEFAPNFEGNASEVLFGRLHNEKIRNQIIDLLFQGEQFREGTFIEKLKEDEKGELVFDDSNEPIVEAKVPYTPLTREEIEQRYDETLDGIESATEIAYAQNSHDTGSSETMYIGAVAPWSGKRFTDKQMNIVEAHEKGHRIRHYVGTFFDEHFKQGFDFSNVPYGEKEAAIFKKALPLEDQDKSTDEVREMFFDYLLMPMELTERMSQIKNYYGMSSDEIFTKAHLDYARKYYISDTDMDNGMTQFFQAITPEKEEAFLELVNSVGV